MSFKIATIHKGSHPNDSNKEFCFQWVEPTNLRSNKKYPQNLQDSTSSTQSSQEIERPSSLERGCIRLELVGLWGGSIQVGQA